MNMCTNGSTQVHLCANKTQSPVQYSLYVVALPSLEVSQTICNYALMLSTHTLKKIILCWKQKQAKATQHTNKITTSKQPTILFLSPTGEDKQRLAINGQHVHTLTCHKGLGKDFVTRQKKTGVLLDRHADASGTPTSCWLQNSSRDCVLISCWGLALW